MYFFLPTNIPRTLLNKDLLIFVPGPGLQLLLVFIMKSAKNVIKNYFLHRRMGHGFRFLLPPFLYYPPPPVFSKFSYESFLFQNFHNHSFFLHLTISVDVIHHE